MNKKTIAIIGEDFGVGGTGKGVYSIELFKTLKKLKSEFNIKLFLRDTASFDFDDVIKVKTLKTRTRILAGLGYYIPLLFKLSRDKSVDIIHAYDEKTSAFLSLLKKPQIATVYDLCPIGNKFPLNYIFRIIYRLLSRNKFIIVVSNYIEKVLSQEYAILSKKIVPIHLGVDINRFKPAIKKDKSYVNIGVLGQLDEELWNAFERILREYGDKVKIILGGNISKKFDYLKSYPRIIIEGFIKESKLSEYYQNIDIFVHKMEDKKSALKKTGFELIPLEAMSSGCAVIASNVDALPEVIQNNGLLANNTEEQFYKSIKKLTDNKALRRKYQKMGRERAEELTWNECAKKHIELYRKIIKYKSFYNKILINNSYQ